VVRAVVTGGAGFVGSHVVDALLALDAEVHVVDDLSSGQRQNVPAGATLHVADVSEPLDRLFFAIRPDAVFHLAAKIDVRASVSDPVVDAQVNVIGTIRVLEAARPHSARVVLASTGGAIYGECDGPAAEDAPRSPVAPYGTSKLAAEQYLSTWNRLHGTRHVSLRLGNVYGPRQNPHGEAGVVAIFLRRLRDGEQVLIYGNGRQTRDYVYAGDAARAFVAALDVAGGVFNVGTGVETSVADLFAACCEVAGAQTEAVFSEPRLGELQRSALDPGLARTMLRWRSTVGLDDGLRRTWEWINARGKE
jgi:UDP-glucose 4-epimerase